MNGLDRSRVLLLFNGLQRQETDACSTRLTALQSNEREAHSLLLPEGSIAFCNLRYRYTLLHCRLSIDATTHSLTRLPKM